MTKQNSLRKRALAVVGRRLNPLTRRMAYAGTGPFSLVRHTGRRSGRQFETPLILARIPGGFVAELTWGDRVDWYRNIVAAGGCTVLVAGREHRIGAIEPLDTERGRAAFPLPARLLLRLLRKREYRLLREG